MNPGVTPAQAPTRNPVARSLALAVLAVALVGAAIMGAVVFAVLLGLFAVGYLVSLLHAWWRLFRLRRRAAFVDQSPAFAEQSSPASPKADYIEGEYAVVEATADVAQRGSGGSA